MAKPIKETPILYGKDAKRFKKRMKKAEKISPEVRKANREKLFKRYDEICKEWNLTFEGI